MGGERMRRDQPVARGAEQPRATAVATRQGGATSAPLASLTLDDLVGDRGGDGGSGVPTVQAELEVGPVDDPYERDADRMADQVMRDIDPGGATAPLPSGRIARSTEVEVGAEGGQVSPTLAREIGSSRGSAMPDALRSTMEDGFGRDLSDVRVHTDSDAAGRIQARAFTQGSDVHFAPGQFQPDTPGGRRLIAHELAHVVQQRDGRMVSRLMWDNKRFQTETNETFTTKSTAQKTIGQMLDEYHTTWPFGDLDEQKATDALAHVMKMRAIAEAYVSKNVKSVDGEDIVRSSRKNRVAGFSAFIAACQGEEKWLTQRIDRGKDESSKFDSSTLEQSVSSDARVTKLKDHYAGDAASCFRKLGALIDMAVPAPGDSASISLGVEIPIEPGLSITLNLGAGAERGGKEKPNPQPGQAQSTKETASRVDVDLNVDVGVAADAKVAKVGAAIGGYVHSSAQTGADAAELISYALFRRCRSSKLVPREVSNFMWGEGNSDAFGWQVAEAWSLGVENRLLGSFAGEDGGEGNENYVETGGYGKASAEVEFGKLAKLETEIMGYTGTRIDAESLKARKGGAGKANLVSGAAPTSQDRMTKQGMRGTTQKDVGRSTHGFKISAEAGNDFIGGGLEFGMRWISDGAHGAKTYKLLSAELGGAVKFTMPGDQLIAGGVGNHVPALIKTLNTLIARGRDRAAEQEGKTARDLGALGAGIGSIAASVAELGSDPESWTPSLEMDDSESMFSSSTTYELSVSGDFVEKKLNISLKQEKSSELGKAAKEITGTAGGAAGVKLEWSKASTLLDVEWDGTKWTFTWAGS